jgi:hypothetical protein
MNTALRQRASASTKLGLEKRGVGAASQQAVLPKVWAS